MSEKSSCFKCVEYAYGFLDPSYFSPHMINVINNDTLKMQTKNVWKLILKCISTTCLIFIIKWTNIFYPKIWYLIAFFPVLGGWELGAVAICRCSDEPSSAFHFRPFEAQLFLICQSSHKTAKNFFLFHTRTEEMFSRVFLGHNCLRWFLAIVKRIRNVCTDEI